MTNYLQMARHDDRTDARRLRDELANVRMMVNHRMQDARFWKKHGNAKRVANCVMLARRESQKAQDVLRKLREVEARS